MSFIKNYNSEIGCFSHFQFHTQLKKSRNECLEFRIKHTKEKVADQMVIRFILQVKGADGGSPWVPLAGLVSGTYLIT